MFRFALRRRALVVLFVLAAMVGALTWLLWPPGIETPLTAWDSKASQRDCPCDHRGRVFVPANDRLQVRDCEPGALIVEYPFEERTSGAAISHDRRFLAVGTEGGALFLWRLEGPDLVRLGPPAKLPDKPVRMAFAAEAPFLAVLCSYLRPRLFLHNHATNETQAAPAMSGSLRVVAVHPKGTQVFAADYGADVLCWDVATGEVRRVSFFADRESVTALLALPQKGLLVIGTRSGKVALVALSTLEVQDTFTTSVGPVWSLACSADEEALAVGGGDFCKLPCYPPNQGRIQVFDLHSNRARRVITAYKLPVHSLCFAGRDPARLVSVDVSGSLKVWEFVP